MRYRATFLVGFAAGFVVGTRAGRERYEQMERLARRAADTPAVRQAMDSVSGAATGFAKNAADKASSKMPGIAETARQKAAGRFDHIPGLRGRAGSAGSEEGSRTEPFAPAPGSVHGLPDGT